MSTKKRMNDLGEKIKLYGFQKEVLNNTKKFNRVAYYLDMGLGKTFVGSEKMKDLNKKTNLLICQKSKIKDWIDHFNNYYDYEVFDLTNKKQLEKYFESDNLKVGIINYELSFRRSELMDLENFTLCLDESSMIQNHKAKRTKAILKMKASNVILLSGTPTSGKFENLYSQCRLLGWNITLNDYNSRYINWENLRIGATQFIKIVDRKNPYKNVDELKLNLRNNGAVFLKTEEVFDLPSKNFVRVNCKKPKAYVDFIKDDFVIVNGEEIVGDTPLTKMLSLRKLSGIFNKNKIQALKDLIESTDDRLIIFYNFNAEKDEIKKVIPKERPVSEISGKKKDLRAFEDENNSITLVQYQAGSMGLNLQKANKIIYFSPTLSSELFEQSKKRTHRIGQERPCFYYLLTAEGSIEEKIYKTLKMRKDYTNELFKEDFGNFDYA